MKRHCAFLISLLCLLVVMPLSAAKPKPVISGEFTLVNHLGSEVSKSTYDGFYRLVFFGFTRCPDICPTTMAIVSSVMRHLGDKSDRVIPLFITVDTENDTVEQIAAYVSVFHPSIIGLTGSALQLEAAAKGFNVTSGKSLDKAGVANGSFYHSSYLYLMDKEGDFLDVFGYGTPSEMIVESLNKILE